MTDPQPNWQDLYNRARASADADFDREFEEATREQTQGQNQEQQENGRENQGEQAADHETVERNRREQELIDALNGAREQFAYTEFHDRSRMDRLRKALNMMPTREDSPNISSARDSYQASLRQYLDFQIEKLQLPDENGNVLQGERLVEEIKKLHSFYNLDEATKYYDARTQVKMDHLASETDQNGNEKGFFSKTWDKIRLKSTQVSEWYKEVPTSYKLGLAAASFAAGSASALALGKRAWGAAMVMTTLGANLDTLARKNDARISRKEGNKLVSELSGENGEIDMDRLRSILDEKINDIDDKLNKKNVRSGFNKILAFSAAIFLGATTAEAAVDLANDEHADTGGKLFGRFFAHKAEVSSDVSGTHEAASAAKNATGTMHESANVETPYTDAFEGHTSQDGSELPPIPKTGIFADGNFDHVTPNGAAPIDPDKFDHVTPSGAPSAAEQAAHIKEMAATHDTELRIEKGSSIERTLIDHIKKVHPDIKNPGHVAHRMWLDYMDDNKEAIIKKVGDTEYHKMLKDGMVNVKPGTILSIDEHDPLKLKLHDIEGKISHLNGGHHVELNHADYGDNEVPKNLNPADGSDNVPTGNKAELPRDAVTDYSRLETELQTEDAIREMDQKYSDAASDALMNPATHDGPSMEQYEKMGTFDQARKDFREFLQDLRAQDTPWIGEHNIQTLLENGAESKQLLRASLNNLTEGHISKSGYWSEIKNQPVMKIAFENGRMNDRFASVFNQYEKVIGFDNSLPVDENETTGQWIARLTKLALKKRG